MQESQEAGSVFYVVFRCFHKTLLPASYVASAKHDIDNDQSREKEREEDKLFNQTTGTAKFCRL